MHRQSDGHELRIFTAWRVLRHGCSHGGEWFSNALRQKRRNARHSFHSYPSPTSWHQTSGAAQHAENLDPSLLCEADETSGIQNSCTWPHSHPWIGAPPGSSRDLHDHRHSRKVRPIALSPIDCEKLLLEGSQKKIHCLLPASVDLHAVRSWRRVRWPTTSRALIKVATEDTNAMNSSSLRSLIQFKCFKCLLFTSPSSLSSAWAFCSAFAPSGATAPSRPGGSHHNFQVGTQIEVTPGEKTLQE